MLGFQVAQVVAQALRQADTDVAIEAWADRSAAPRNLAQLMAEVRFPAAPHSQRLFLLR